MAYVSYSAYVAYVNCEGYPSRPREIRGHYHVAYVAYLSHVAYVNCEVGPNRTHANISIGHH